VTKKEVVFVAKLMKGDFRKYHPAICTNLLNWLIDLVVIIAWLIVIYNKADSTSVSYYLSLFISFPCNGCQFNDIKVTACYVVVKYTYIEKKISLHFLHCIFQVTLWTSKETVWVYYIPTNFCCLALKFLE